MLPRDLSQPDAECALVLLRLGSHFEDRRFEECQLAIGIDPVGEVSRPCGVVFDLARGGRAGRVFRIRGRLLEVVQRDRQFLRRRPGHRQRVFGNLRCHCHFLHEIHFRFGVRKSHLSRAEQARPIHQPRPGRHWASNRDEELGNFGRKHRTSGECAAVGKGRRVVGQGGRRSGGRRTRVSHHRGRGGSTLTQRIHQCFELRSRKRPAQIRQRPAGFEDFIAFLVNVVQKKYPAAKAGKNSLRRRAVKGGALAGRRPFQSFQHAHLVSFGLQAADEPRTNIRKALVIQVHGILRRQQDADAKPARLFQQGEQRELRWRIGHRREVAKDFVHVHQRAEAAGARLGAHPAEHLVEQQRDEEHPLRVAQVRDRENGDARLARGGMEQPADIQRFALQPRRKAGRREEAVQEHRQVKTVFRGKKRVDVDHANASQGRGLHFLDQRRQVEAAALGPGLLEDLR